MNLKSILNYILEHWFISLWILLSFYGLALYLIELILRQIDSLRNKETLLELEKKINSIQNKKKENIQWDEKLNEEILKIETEYLRISSRRKNDYIKNKNDELKKVFRIF